MCKLRCCEREGEREREEREREREREKEKREREREEREEREGNYLILIRHCAEDKVNPNFIHCILQ